MHRLECIVLLIRPQLILTVNVNLCDLQSQLLCDLSLGEGVLTVLLGEYSVYILLLIVFDGVCLV
jgi:hypothetical protein